MNNKDRNFLLTFVGRLAVELEPRVKHCEFPCETRNGKFERNEDVEAECQY
jgi:hypothetical protein